MKTEIRKYVAAALICLGMSSCSDFFESIPGKQFGLEETFASKQRTEQYLNNVYSYIREVGDVLHVDANMNGTIFTEASLEGANRWNKTYAEWTTGGATASYSQANRYFTDYYQAIAKASTFIQNAVSYTHLDVYKRQPCSLMNMTFVRCEAYSWRLMRCILRLLLYFW